MKARIKVGWEAFWRKIYRDLDEPFRPLPLSLSEGSIVEVVKGSVSNKGDKGQDLGEYFADIVGADGRGASIQTKFLEEVKDS